MQINRPNDVPTETVTPLRIISLPFWPLISGKSRDERHLIRLQVGEPRQLFETLDPFPFRERDIDRDAEAYIVSWARELPRDAPWCIVIHMPSSQVREELGNELTTAFARFFSDRARTATLDLKELFRVGRYSLVLGATTLILATLASQYASAVISSPALARTVEESFLILGWVANWRPLEIFLYDWLPIVRRRSLFRRLAKSEVVVRPGRPN